MKSRWFYSEKYYPTLYLYTYFVLYDQVVTDLSMPFLINLGAHGASEATL